MADDPSSSNSPPPQYWCNHCTKFVSTDSILGATICHDCRRRLPEFISAAAATPPPPPPLLLHTLPHFTTTPSPSSPPPPPPRRPFNHILPEFNFTASAATNLSSFHHRMTESNSAATTTTSPPASPHEIHRRLHESILALQPPHQLDRDIEETDAIDFANVELDDEFFRIFHLIADGGREESPPPSPPSPPSENGFGYDYLRLDLGAWEIDETVQPNGSSIARNQESGVESFGILSSVNEVEGQNNNNRESGQRRRRPFVLRPVIENHSRRRRRAALGLDDLGARAATRRHRVVRWADYFAGSEEHSFEVPLQLDEGDTYFGNPGDYVDAAGYEAFLRVLAERDNGGNRGAPPAGKTVVMGLESVVFGKEEGEVMVCAVCRDSVNVGELVKKLPCRHTYHGDCIVQWLKVRNSCPVCRFELPTDDPEYEVERKQKMDRRTDGVDGGTSMGNAGDGGSGSAVVESSYDSID